MKLFLAKLKDKIIGLFWISGFICYDISNWLKKIYNRIYKKYEKEKRIIKKAS